MPKRHRHLTPDVARDLLERMDRYAPGKRPDVREVLAHYVSPDIHFRGEIVSLQSRIRLLRSFDQAHHVYLGYALLVRPGGTSGEADLAIGIGKGAQAKHQLRVGDVVEGEAKPVEDVPLETVKYYNVVRLKVLSRPPSWSSRWR